SAPYYFASETHKDTTYRYDGLDRLVEEIYADGTRINVSHDISSAAGEMATVLVSDETDRQTRYNFNAFDKLVERVKLYGSGTSKAVTNYQRDLLSRISKVLDPLGNRWTYQYDGLSRRRVVDDPDLGHWTYDYDDAGHLKNQTDAKAQATTLGYDSM